MKWYLEYDQWEDLFDGPPPIDKVSAARMAASDEPVEVGRIVDRWKREPVVTYPPLADGMDAWHLHQALEAAARGDI